MPRARRRDIGSFWSGLNRQNASLTLRTKCVAGFHVTNLLFGSHTRIVDGFFAVEASDRHGANIIIINGGAGSHFVDVVDVVVDIAGSAQTNGVRCSCDGEGGGQYEDCELHRPISFVCLVASSFPDFRPSEELCVEFRFALVLLDLIVHVAYLS